MKDEIKVIKLIQQEAQIIDSVHSKIQQDLQDIKKDLLKALDDNIYLDDNIVSVEQNTDILILPKKTFSEIVDVADSLIQNEVNFRDILNDNDLLKIGHLEK